MQAKALRPELTGVLALYHDFQSPSTLLLTSPFEKGGLRGILKNSNPLILNKLFL